MKQRILSAIAILTLLVGLSFLLYPTVSNYFNVTKQRRAVYNYVSSVEELSDDDYMQLLEAAKEYNKKLAASPPGLLNLSETQQKEYESVLDITGTGIMGYINIEKADISLPIYHGTSEAVLQVGAGHMEGSSLPVGGQSVHSILSGHRGLPSAMLFTNLDMLKRGDTFAIHVLGETYSYRVSAISTVLPEDLYDLKIESGKDICTLVTCTPYGINTHRLVIRGERIFPSEIEEKLAIQSGARFIPTWRVVLIIEAPILLISVIVSTRRIRKKR